MPRQFVGKAHAFAAADLRTSQVAKAAFFRIMDLWGVASEDARTLLGRPSRTTFFGWKKAEGAALSRDTLIGTNNIRDGATNMATKLGTLLDLVIGSDPNLLLVFAKIIPARVDGDIPTIRAYNDAMPAMVKPRRCGQAHHPDRPVHAYLFEFELQNRARYTVMAQAWCDTLKSYLR